MTVRVVCLSDTHNKHWLLPPPPPGDVLVHAGDFSVWGSAKEILDFNRWLGLQPHPVKVVVPGNHDVLFDGSWWHARGLLSNAQHVLNDKGCSIGDLKLWGSPWTPEFMDWGFGYGKREGEVRWSQIPKGLDLLITHGPPRMILDLVYDKEQKRTLNVGCPHLRREVLERAQPRVHVFGHVHDGYGRGTFNGVDCINVAQLATGNEVTSDRCPVVVDL